MKVLKYMFFGILLFIEVPLWADSMGYENVLKNVSFLYKRIMISLA